MSKDKSQLFRLPKLYENMDEAAIGAWLVAEGEPVEEGQPLVELVTDKATVEFESTMAGQVLKIYAPVKSMAPVGYILACIGEAGQTAPDVSAENEALAAAWAEQSAVANDTEESGPEEAPAQAGPQKPRAAPAARKLARESGVDLERLAARLGGRVIHRKDVEEYLQQHE